ncbi:toll/interleukin-1 receptor domain-containing protein [Scopulibacillus cellulosilyticus]|uniref:Toll/interleukin-1 receptor domain-containing protein n=1 Tax=Scopulibacillus cellulosilyticus TaxID=2665665 RepID=A0ABW2PXL2_9BACL
MDKVKSVFVSYSWDNDEHQKWVLNLTNKLRTNGVDATIDLFETQNGTTNLNKMMIQGLRDSDSIIIVLTEKYANRANKFEGGVGFETTLSLPILKNNPNRLIFILRHKENYLNAFPFHYRDYYAIDFSDDVSFENAFRKLLYHIAEVPLFEKSPLGKMPILQPINSNSAINVHETIESG